MFIKSLARGLSTLLVLLLGGVAVAQHSTASYIQQVNSANGTITNLASNLNPSQYTQAVTFSVNVPSDATGTVQFFDGSAKINTAAAVTSGSASTTISTLSLGNHNITATYSGDSNYSSITTTTALVQKVNIGASGLTLASGSNPSTFSSNVVFTASLASAATGTVTFYDGSTQIGLPVTVASGTAALTISTLTVGTHSITAQYSGDTNFSAATSNIVSQVVNKGGTTTDVLISSLNPATYGATVTFTATLPANATGTVTFYDGATAMGPAVTVSAGAATFSTSTLSVNTHSITATYGGDTNYGGVTSNIVAEVINQKTGETITLTSATNPAAFGAPVVFTAKVPTDATGTVTFYDGTTAMGAAVSVSGGVATFTTSTLSVGTHSITATYNGDSNYASVTTPTAVSQVISASSGTATMTIVGVPNPSVYGANVTMTITVTGVNSVIPTGTVTLTDNGNPLGTTLTLDATGKATYQTTALSAGSHPITATYSGDSNYK